ncbi:tyrosine-type recombinase/integrase [Planobispora rosea]|uniref:tyrosine-type recombinase/integrase n=1 Tax=Planobispora rosea TaxID=35762 RepID=UPI000A031387|nr:tyrosine-type recombinase/integrase [Planobispora rosea]
MRRICEACPPHLLGVRDRAMFLLGFAIGARRSELSALNIGDVTEVERGLEIHVRWSKTGTERFPKVPYGQHLSTCPVRAWRAWLAASGLADGAAFRHIDRYGRLRNRLSPEGVGDALTAAAARAGLGHRTAHGLRSGMSTEGRRMEICTARPGLPFPTPPRPSRSNAAAPATEPHDHHRHDLRDHQPATGPSHPRPPRRADPRSLVNRGPAPHPRRHLPRGRLQGPRRCLTSDHGEPAQPGHRPGPSDRLDQHRGRDRSLPQSACGWSSATRSHSMRTLWP